MMRFYLSVDGRGTYPDEPVLSALDRAFLYGDGVFEVYRTYGGRPFGEAAHMERLLRSAESLGFSSRPSASLLVEEVGRALEEAGHADALVRVMLSRGVGGVGIDPRGADCPRRLILVSELSSPPERWYREGVDAAIVATPRWLAGRPEAGAKAMSYLDNLLVTAAAREAGAHEALYVDPHGQLLEGASSNLFIVEAGRLKTPRLSTGILPGVTRDTVLRLARREGLEVREEAIFPAELYRADEAFITSSIRELVSLVRVDGGAIGAGRPGEVAGRLRALYRVEVADVTGSD